LEVPTIGGLKGKLTGSFPTTEEVTTMGRLKGGKVYGTNNEEVKEPMMGRIREPTIRESVPRTLKLPVIRRR